MRATWHPKLLLLFCLFLMAACSKSSDKDSDPTSAFPIARVTVSEARVFEYPSRDAEVMFRLIEGDETPVLAKTEADLIGVVWYQVGEKAQFGWVAGSQVEITGDLSSVRTVDASVWAVTPTLVAVVETPTETPTPISEKPQAQVNVSEAIVLDAPSRTAPEVSRLFEGEIVDVLGRIEPDEQGDLFYFVGRNGFVLGWVLAAQVTLQGDAAAIPLLADVDTSLSALLPTGTLFAASPMPSATSAAPLPSETTLPVSATEISPTVPPTSTLRISPTPSQTPDLASTAQAAPTATLVSPPPTPSLVPTGVAALQEGEPPPLTLTLPVGWEAVHILVPINSAYLQGELPVSIYTGSLSAGATGTLWIIWGFPNVTSPSGDINLYGDGVQLLRGLLFDPETCDIGLGSEERQYKVGGLDAVGTIYSAVGCEGSNDIAGFFAVLQVEGGNFAFYVGVEPVTATSTGLHELQAVLDSVQFDVDQ